VSSKNCLDNLVYACKPWFKENGYGKKNMRFFKPLEYDRIECISFQRSRHNKAEFFINMVVIDPEITRFHHGGLKEGQMNEWYGTWRWRVLNPETNSELWMCQEGVLVDGSMVVSIINIERDKFKLLPSRTTLLYELLGENPSDGNVLWGNPFMRAEIAVFLARLEGDRGAFEKACELLKEESKCNPLFSMDEYLKRPELAW